ncbi:hypothetical protein [Streptomyces sp. NPDC048272]|uniref:hypothetical protein n=1 Tax=Streptomyces sp. NPDC048272 TaxID=3154616 RepID=UPI00342593C2
MDRLVLDDTVLPSPTPPSSTCSWRPAKSTTYAPLVQPRQPARLLEMSGAHLLLDVAGEASADGTG